MTAPLPHYAGVRHCPYQPCRTVPGVTMYLRQPGDKVPTLPLIDQHPLDAEHRVSGEQCPASLMRLPVSARDRATLARDRIAYIRRAANTAAVRVEAPATGDRVPEHSLTPHPTENRQWFVTGPERRAQAMTSAGEIKQQLGVANMAMAEAQEFARQADSRVAEARTILAGLIGATGVPLGLVACAAASENLTAVHAMLHGGIEQNSAYMEGL